MTAEHKHTPETKPCKDCGSGAPIKVFGRFGGGVHAHYVNCCQCWAESGYSDTREGAIAKWNAMNSVVTAIAAQEG